MSRDPLWNEPPAKQPMTSRHVLRALGRLALWTVAALVVALVIVVCVYVGMLVYMSTKGEPALINL